MFRYNTLITTAAILALANLTQALSFQIAYKASTVNFFSASASANLGVIPMKRGHHRTDTFLFYKNKEFEDDAEDTNTKQLQVEANTNANTNTNTNSAVVDVETKELRVVSEAPPKKSRVTRVVTSSIPAKKYVHTVVNLHEYNEKMKEENHKLVVIRFFSHWCKVRLSCFLQDQDLHRQFKEEVQSTIDLFDYNHANLCCFFLLKIKPIR